MNELTLDDVKRFPVWEYVHDDTAGDETFVRPVEVLPVDDLRGRVVGLRVRLANGTLRDALVGNFDCRNSNMNAHFATLSIYTDGKWVPLARYHDFDYDTAGPQSLSAALSLSLSDVFPIGYDLTPYVDGDRLCLVGVVDATPEDKLTRAELIALAMG